MKVKHARARRLSTATAMIVAGLVTASPELYATARLDDATRAQDLRSQGKLSKGYGKLAAADGVMSRLDVRGLIETFDDEFTHFSWYADGVIGGKPGGGTWRTHFGYAGVQDRNSRTLASNGEQEIYVDRAFRGTAKVALGLNPFRIANGNLEITADRAPAQVRPYIWNYAYTSGLITTRGTFAQQYGVFEARARMPKGRGLWSCLWLLPAPSGWPPEIDIAEILGTTRASLLQLGTARRRARTREDRPQPASRMRPPIITSTPLIGKKIKFAGTLMMSRSFMRRHRQICIDQCICS